MLLNHPNQSHEVVLQCFQITAQSAYKFEHMVFGPLKNKEKLGYNIQPT